VALPETHEQQCRQYQKNARAMRDMKKIIPVGEDLLTIHGISSPGKFLKNRHIMKKNTSYLVIGCISILLPVPFWFIIKIDLSFIIEAVFIIVVAGIYFIRSKVTDLKEDERDIKIFKQAMKRIMQIFRVVFCVFSVNAVMRIVRVPAFPIPQSLPPPQEMGGISHRTSTTAGTRVWSARFTLSDDFPLFRLQGLLCTGIRRLENR
jgi:uncharacterized membrane protein